MEVLTNLCRAAKTFPQDCREEDSLSCNTNRHKRLDAYAAKLFSDDKDPSLDLFEFSREGKGTYNTPRPLPHVLFSSVLILLHPVPPHSFQIFLHNPRIQISIFPPPFPLPTAVRTWMCRRTL